MKRATAKHETALEEPTRRFAFKQRAINSVTRKPDAVF
jgi:hypothetical protein